jgi:hypothetical protein
LDFAHHLGGKLLHAHQFCIFSNKLKVFFLSFYLPKLTQLDYKTVHVNYQKIVDISNGCDYHYKLDMENKLPKQGKEHLESSPQNQCIFIIISKSIMHKRFVYALACGFSLEHGQ